MSKPTTKTTVQQKKSWSSKKTGKKYQQTSPYIKLSGKWIEQNGFPIGRICKVEVEFGKITIT